MSDHRSYSPLDFQFPDDHRKIFVDILGENNAGLINGLEKDVAFANAMRQNPWPTKTEVKRQLKRINRNIHALQISLNENNRDDHGLDETLKFELVQELPGNFDFLLDFEEQLWRIHVEILLILKRWESLPSKFKPDTPERFLTWRLAVVFEEVGLKFTSTPEGKGERAMDILLQAIGSEKGDPGRLIRTFKEKVAKQKAQNPN